MQEETSLPPTAHPVAIPFVGPCDDRAPAPAPITPPDAPLPLGGKTQFVSPACRAEASAAGMPRASLGRCVRPLVTIFSWLLAAVVMLVGARFFVPNLAEEIQYSLTRGRLRAEYDAAGRELASAPLDDLSRSFQLVSKRVGPSVVHINTVSNQQVENDALTGVVGPRLRVRQGQGSGVIVENDGFILTNYHVIRDSSRIEVHLSDGSTREAVEIGHDAATDLAVLKVEASELIPAEWGESSVVEVGAPVWAVGSPFGLEHSVTFGILSAKNRAGQAGTVYQDFLQTDVAVNPGNSGGPLVDAGGRVIGINTAIVGQTYQGISFAIPSDVARQVYQRLKTERRVARGWLGVLLDDVDAQRAKELGLPEAKGAYIEAIVDQFGPSPAGRAGVQAGDVIVRFGGVAIDSPMKLSQEVARTTVGARAAVVLIRAGRELELEVQLAERPSEAN
jgi:S1-C subfamily serine protease